MFNIYHVIMNCSNEIFLKLVPTYSGFENYKYDYFIGYKLADKKNLNYYSVITGLFRYKKGKIGGSSYSTLYEKNKNIYNKKLHNKLAVFVNKKDAIDALKDFEEMSGEYCDLVILKIKISGELETAYYTNFCVDNKPVVIGSTIDHVSEI